MSTAIAVVETGKYLALAEGSEVAEALAANFSPGETFQESDLIRVPTPAGGAKKWIIPTVSGDESAEAINGVLVFYGLGGVLWPSTDPAPGTLPLLRTDDLVFARKVGNDFGDIDPEVLKQHEVGDGIYKWKDLPWNQFGSGKSGRGKRCQEYRTLCVLRAGDTFPLLVRAKPGSLKTVAPFVKQLPVPHYRAEVSLGLTKQTNQGGQPYSQIVPRLTGTLTREQGEAVRKLYTEPLRNLVQEINLAEDLSGDE